MIPYRNIIVALDDSKYSEAALIEAAHLAKGQGGTVSVVHSVYVDSEGFSTSSQQLEERLEAGKKLCEKITGRYSSEFGIEIESIIRQGEPHEVIPEIVLEKKADLIAMGTHGRKGIKKLFMGSVTASLIVEAPCDVLIVKKPCEECTGIYSSVLVPFDGSEYGAKAISRALALKNLNPEMVITLMYVIPRYEEMVDFFKTSAIRKKLQDEARKIILAGEGLAQEKGVSVNSVFDEGNPAEKIVEKAGTLGCDLIVMGSHGWRGVHRAILGSTTERVITYSTIPILIAR